MPTSDRGAPRVLLVDDDPAVAHVIATLLRRSGYTVVVAGSGQDAAHLLDERFDALVLDLRLPGMRGDAFYYQATARQPSLNGRALFLTGDITEQAEELIRATGCRWMLKPFQFAEMLAVLQEFAPLAPPAPERMPRVS
jgi:DNA-binding response OmpR family regulator